MISHKKFAIFKILFFILFNSQQSINADVDEEVAILKEAIIGLKSELGELKKVVSNPNTGNNSVPNGFIYIQLPSEKSPNEIWPKTSWHDISSTYAGVFFRVTGGDAASFGDVQEDYSPRIQVVSTGYDDALRSLGVLTKSNCYVAPCNVTIPKEGWSDWSVTGDFNANKYSRSTRFHSSGGEVRPRNMAIRIWKKIA